MRIFFILVFSCFIISNSFAEYGGFKVQFEIELKRGGKERGCNYLVEYDFNPDSFEFSDFLLQVLLENENNEEKSDSLFFYSYLLAYQYNLVNGEPNKADTIYALLEPKAIAANQITGVRLMSLKKKRLLL
ncbi:MAG: hypothetical protein WED33_05645 [Bacteroidia bacterium]